MTAQVAVADGLLRIEGRVSHRNGDEVCAAGQNLLAAHSELVGVDLGGLEHAGSVVVAVLLVWARERTAPLQLRGVPQSLRRVFEFTGMDDLFLIDEVVPAHG